MVWRTKILHFRANDKEFWDKWRAGCPGLCKPPHRRHAGELVPEGFRFLLLLFFWRSWWLLHSHQVTPTVVGGLEAGGLDLDLNPSTF